MYLPLLKWAAAAVIVLCAGFSLGRLTVSPDKVRAAIAPEIREQVRREFEQLRQKEIAASKVAGADIALQPADSRLAAFARDLEARRSADNQAVFAAIEKLQAQRLNDYISLRKDLETVAVLTDAGLRNTEETLVQLADYKRPETESPKQ